jgi:DNA-binding LytR/AlgR family response regulator
MLNFVMCDDNQNILNRLEKFLESIFINNNLSGQVAFKTTSPDKLINYIEKNPFDVVFLDIDLKDDVSGMDLANMIRKRNKKAYIVFTTAHLEYSMVAYKYKTFDFLAKPITLQRLEETVLRLFDDISSNETNFVRLSKKSGFINSNDILFIQKQGKKAILKTVGNDIELNSSFSNILSHLPDNFIRCHKSYIVNLNKISYIHANNTIFFSDTENIQCQIGPKYEYLFTGG